MNAVVAPARSFSPGERTSIRTVAFASLIGTTIEWYDFFLYGTAAALVFNRLFFPSFAPRLGTLAAIGTYSVGFLARPLGGVVIGHFGDRVGRKAMLVLTLTVMGLATFCIGLLPTYAEWGPWAAVGLIALRLAQGFGVGGEWGGAVLMSIEHAPSGTRGFYGSWPQMGVPAGLILATAVFSLSTRLPEAAFLSWGWRVPFLISIVLVAVGLTIRFRIAETPAFRSVKETGSTVALPVAELLRRYPREILLAVGMRIAENGGFYIYTVFVLVYATQTVGLQRQDILNGVLIASVGGLIALPLWGRLSDRVGRRPVYLFGAVFTVVSAFPLFWLLDTGSVALASFALTLVVVFASAAMYGPQAAFFSELFHASVRYSGVSIGSQIGAVLAGGLSPLIATALLPYGSGAVATFVAGLGAVTVLSVYLATETVGRSVSPEDVP